MYAIHTPFSLCVLFIVHISIDDDILNLIDEVDVDEFLKEAANAIDDPDRLTDFVREKSTIAIERFLVSSCCYISDQSRFSPIYSDVAFGLT
jgi:hypothetical protein